jgi:hypothetical protein
MNINTILKPHPHCPIPHGHPCYRGYVPAAQTDIRKTWANCALNMRGFAARYQDDYELTDALDYLERLAAYKP